MGDMSFPDFRLILQDKRSEETTKYVLFRHMKIVINNREVDAPAGEPLIETARRNGFEIPSLCYAKGVQHTASCMVCAVRNCVDGHIMPSCTTLPVEGMRIDTESSEVVRIRRISLELLLSDHRADCEAPCTWVCPEGLEVERMLRYYDDGRYGEAVQCLAAVFPLPLTGCDTCRAPCEKACRRGSVDKAVSIRTVIRELTAMNLKITSDERPEIHPTDKKSYQSRLGRYTDDEKARLQAEIVTPSRCLHCACAGRNTCKLRVYSTEAGIKRSRYGISSALTAEKIHITDNLWFEPAKCIRCGLCVYNSRDGFTFKGRGFVMQVVLPEESKNHIAENPSELCPTGAIYEKERGLT